MIRKRFHQLLYYLRNNKNEQLTSYTDDVILTDATTLPRGNLAGSTAYYSLHLQHAFLFVYSFNFLSGDLFLIPLRAVFTLLNVNVRELNDSRDSKGRLYDGVTA